jgi:hypothetical protein
VVGALPAVAAETHWAYVAPVRPTPPVTADPAWVINEIDAFVLARLEAEALSPSPPADRARLIRRVYLDLIGLPPTVAEVDAFLADDRPDAYEHVVDTLLASPHYGERWARPWLDLARYADSNGFQRDGFRDVWAFRDWVIRALNDDMPFDRFTIEQIAGDLLPNATVEQRIATGFHRGPTVNVEAGVDQEANRVNAVIDRVNTTGTVWLGTSIGCAQCHEHKYDPFTQRDYYRLFAYFNNTAVETDFRSDKDTAAIDFKGPWIELPQSAEKQARRIEFASYREDMQKKLTPLVEARTAKQDEWEAGYRDDEAQRKKLPKAVLAALTIVPEKRNAADKKKIKDYYLGLQPEIKRLRDALAEVDKALEAVTPPTSLVMVELDRPRTTNIFKRGNFLTKEDEVKPGVPAALHRLPADAPPNRLGLARWLVDPSNPLVARVTVNRWWAEFFGHGLAATLDDLGTRGERPTHPKLLDWLATEFVARGWSTKAIHRLIVTSATYRQTSRLTPERLACDPYNKLYGRGPRVRLDAETIRDNALAVSGTLSRAMAGPPVRPPQPAGIWAVTGKVDNTYHVSRGDDANRRGIYVIWRRSAPYPSMVNFDAPDRASCVVQRPRTNTPLQALTLMNDPVYVEMARRFAQHIVADHQNQNTAERVTHAFRRCLSRHPHPMEIEHLARVVENEQRRYELNPTAAEALVDEPSAELAAWFHVAGILLNLDETITKG